MPIGPILEEHVLATIAHLSPQVAAMVRLQMLTGARPGEVSAIRPIDVTPGGEGMWVYRPAEHKTEHFDRRRAIVLGPRAQAVLRPWLDRAAEAYCFDPSEVVAARNGRRRAGRLSPMTPSQAVRKPKDAPKRKPGRRYSRNSYRIAIHRACLKAGVPAWSPLQLRHTAATTIRARFGLEAAEVVLGHAQADVTEIYAEKDLALASGVAAEIG